MVFLICTIVSWCRATMRAFLSSAAYHTPSLKVCVHCTNHPAAQSGWRASYLRK
ncbi:hypothetical protein CSUI_010621 [Cystoisospora suis]|uniref:Uncharacterized protein n=1 Tax=Cystoisospora suis TaxID=483139 RepID=A0A2C6KGA0_9APIC|nr:hypothetical protein CSUI_010621 [Cystoisospora suis]